MVFEAELVLQRPDDRLYPQPDLRPQKTWHMAALSHGLGLNDLLDDLAEECAG